MIDRRTSHRRVSEQILIWLSSLGIVMICAGITSFMWTVVFPYEIFSQMQLVVEPGATVGGSLHVRVTYCKDINLPPKRVIVTLQNDITIVLPSDEVRLPAGCHTTLLLQPLKPEIPAGTYRLDLTMVYEPWPWRTLVYGYQSPSFTVSR